MIKTRIKKKQAAPKPVQAQWKMASKIGALYLVASDKGLQGVFWKKQKKARVMKSLKGPGEEIKILAQAVRELKEYLGGKRTKFEVPLDAKGSLFQQRVWNQLTKIPYGKTCSYRDIAILMKDENAARAVGTANGENPLCIIVPCHRVIAADGGLGGYSGGKVVKIHLLRLEQKLD